MIEGWSVVLDFVFLSILLLFATILRAKVKIIQRFLIPNALLAGVLGLILGTQILGVIKFSHLEAYTYHLLNLTFAALALGMVTQKGRESGAISTGILMSFTAVIQLLVGLSVTIFLIYTFCPDLFPTFGAMMAMGYATGPGQAYSIGLGWEPYGFAYGGEIGLIFGAMGFFWAFAIGIAFINWAIRKGQTTRIKSLREVPKEVWTGIISRKKQKPVGRLTTSSEAIDTLTLQIALCGLVYLISYCILNPVAEKIPMLWGILFIVTVGVGIGVRNLMERLKVDYLIAPDIQRHISGICVDYMMAAAIAAIPLNIVVEYIWPIIPIGIAGGVVTVLIFLWLPKRVWRDYHFERMIVCYGTLTGTMTSGLALCRVVDPDFSTPAVRGYVYGMPLMFILIMPLFGIISIPISGLGAANPLIFYLVTLLLLMLLAAVLCLCFHFISGKSGIIRNQEKP